MRPRLFFLTVSLAAVVLLAVSCAPATPTETAPPIVFAPPVEEATATEAVTASPESEATLVPATEIPAQAVATSRGPDLEATDPTTVNLASGQLQLVEFFRFT